MRTDPPRGQGARRSALDTECNYRHRCPRMGHALALYSSRPGVSERSIHSYESAMATEYRPRGRLILRRNCVLRRFISLSKSRCARCFYRINSSETGRAPA